MTAEAEKLPEPQQWFTTAEAAEYMRMGAQALRMAVWRGTLTPDLRGGRGRCKAHRFSRATLDSYMRGE